MNNQLSLLLLQLERSPHRASDAENTYLRSSLNIIVAKRRKVDIQIDNSLTNREELGYLDPLPFHPLNINSRIPTRLTGIGFGLSRIDLALLLASRSSLTLYINRCRSALAPYHKLPPELIRLILLFLFPQNLHDSMLYNGQRDFRFQITQICTSWRSVAFSMHELWQIQVPTPAEKPIHICKSSIQLVNTWFRQCSAVHFGLTMIGSWEVKVMFPSPLPLFDSAFAELVVPYANRFRSLGLLVMSELQWKALSSLPFESLVSLTLDLGCLGKDKTSIEPILAPSLRCLRVAFLPSIRLLCNIPWKQLKSLSLSGNLTIDGVSEMLAQCSSLETCDLRGIRETENKSSCFDRPLVIPNLSSLSINFVSTTLLNWLSALSTPKLSSLTLFALPDTPETLYVLTEYIARISNTLHRFEVKESPGGVWKSTETMYIEQVLRTIPWATHVYLSDECPLSTPIMEKIGVRELIPHVESLRFAGIESVNRVVNLLIPPQQDCSTTLRRVVYSSILPGSNPKGPRIQELATQGVDIEINMFW
ncbi:hypothetical protein BDZ94DRAFT_1313946 [Collybia nuda]|uniref:F-box domain-containing protein n=1 Tax=Collybia nuda TaxID=64659 RepID=A0A9P6CD26_9AGAR|nr:hypothetical protein BDZ94DRAFT_1313946 [Collybia nuda]